MLHHRATGVSGGGAHEDALLEFLGMRPASVPIDVRRKSGTGLPVRWLFPLSRRGFRIIGREQIAATR